MRLVGGPAILSASQQHWLARLEGGSTEDLQWNFHVMTLRFAGRAASFASHNTVFSILKYSVYFTWHSLSGFKCLFSRAVKQPGLSLLFNRLRGQCITIKNRSCNYWAHSNLILSICGDWQSNTSWPKEFLLNQRKWGVSSALSSTEFSHCKPANLSSELGELACKRRKKQLLSFRLTEVFLSWQRCWGSEPQSVCWRHCRTSRQQCTLNTW